MSERKNVMVSSTARDLPEHRKEVMDACLRQGMFPDMMEHLPASDADAIRVSLEMVERADIYLGVFAHRYGYVPKENNPKKISITEMEYDRAVERNIPRLIFIMHEDHPIKAADVETGEGAEKLKKLKEQIGTERVCGFFKSPDDLRGLVIQALTPYREADITQFHYISDIPIPPDAYIAHQYSLLQTHKLVGRQDELNILTDWVKAGKSGHISAFTDVRIMNIVAIGGMGKSALTWKWFNDIAPQEMKPLSGRVWWSFYESDASFENFIIRVLAYVTRQSREEVKKISPLDREAQLLAILDREPFLLVLDGLERIFLAYARMDAARLIDDDIDQRTANQVPRAYSLSESAANSHVGQHLLRKTADPRAGAFLRKLANARASRILVNTRLYPADLQMTTGESMHGCFAIFLRGLKDDDALDLWRAFKVSGSREMLLPMFHKFENHPLLIQSLASEVGNYRHAPGDFEHWRRDHSGFNPFNLSLVNVRAHVLEYALLGLDDKARKVLDTIAAFRMPAGYDVLAALFVGDDKFFSTELELDVTLKELEDRGLLGWDKRANRYDLHPIVRGVVWNELSDDRRNGIFTVLQVHFGSLPKIDDWKKINSFEDLTPAIELYNSLIGLGLYNDALRLFFRYIHNASRFRLGVGRQRTELLEMLFPDGLEHLPRLLSLEKQADALKALAAAYWDSGQLRYAALLYERSVDSVLLHQKSKDISFGMRNLASVLRQSGALRKSEAINRQVLLMNRDDGNPIEEAVSLNRLGYTLAVRNIVAPAEIAIRRSKQIFVSRGNIQSEGICNAFLAQLALWQQNITVAATFSDRARELAYDYGRESLRAARLQGTIALCLDNQPDADERLHYALVRARTENRIEEELPALIALAALRRWQGNSQAARQLLDGVWEYAERGPYPLFHADAFNVLAQIERDAGNNSASVEAATNAYQLAWCDGEPYVYYWGLVAARKHLKELDAPEPEMPPFDESKFEPMPYVEINPKDEFWVDPDKDFDIDDLSKK